MSLDHRLIDLLVCPLCKGPLQMGRDAAGRQAELICPADRLAFPIRDGMPVMLEDEARALGTQPESAPAQPMPTVPPMPTDAPPAP